MSMTMSPLVTTYLEMRSPEQLRPKRADTRFQIREQKERDWHFNRDLYFAVGEQWHWIDKRPWTDEQWKEYAAAPELRTFAAYYDNALAGYYELRNDTEGGVEIAYFGLLPEFIGRGLGGALLTSAIEEAWSRGGGIAPMRVWVHTCNRDHSQALANYQARGMVVYKIEESEKGNVYE
jgi:ribosomal protein S18 acetylase RimI-like enzyme